MIVCPNCNHPNPDGAVQCEACYTPLPATTNCPNCGATVQADAAFCGQCGFNLRATAPTAVASTVAPDPTVAPDLIEVPPIVNPDPLVSPQTVPIGVTSPSVPTSSPLPPTAVAPPSPPASLPEESSSGPPPTVMPEPVASQQQTPAPQVEVQAEVEAEPTPAPTPQPQSAAQPAARTQLQHMSARLIHIQTDREIELPQNLPVIHMGKPNDRIPPDIDVSGFPNSEIVSRIHADIRLEGDAYYIEDVGSSNGTYINNLPLLPGNRHRLRPGDRISLGKGDLVSFLFQFS